MFGSLKNLWRSEAPLEQQYAEFVEMLRMGRVFYGTVLDVLHGDRDVEALRVQIYSTDVKINKRERQIRKEIIAHLSVSPGEEVPACLVLMSIVKDAERIGDFCKNLYESAVYLGKPIAETKFAYSIDEFELYVEDLFDDTITAFKEEDEVRATEIMQDEVRMNKRFDYFLQELAGSDVPTREAVCTTLIVRSLKRIQAHLSNIASSVVLPVHHIDHRPSSMREHPED
jgi:phosphate uptake regulator